MLNLPPEELRATLRSCLDVPRWIDEMLAAAPFDSRDQLLSVARATLGTLTEPEVEAALADHPRIGEKRSASGAAQTFSAAEQASSDAEDASINAAIAPATPSTRRLSTESF